MKKNINNLERFIKSLEDGFLRADNDGYIIIANDAIAHMCKYSSPEEMIGLQMKELYANADDREYMISEIRSKGKLHNYELILKRKDGSIFWSLSNIKTFSDDNGKVLGTEGLIRDITSIKQTEEELRVANQQLSAQNQQLVAIEQQLRAANQQLEANEQQLKSANQQLTANEQELLRNKETTEHYLNVAAEIILSLDKKGNITLLNKSGHKLFGYKNGELIGKNWFDHCLPQKDIKEIKNVFNQTISGHLENVTNYESDILTKSGEIKTIFWHNTILKDENGEITAVLSSGENITERKKAEKALRISEENIKNTFNLSPSIIAKANLIKGYFIEANHAVTRILGYSVEEFISKPFIELIHPDDQQKSIDEKKEQIKGKEVNFFENRYLCKDGSYKWIAWNGTRADKNGMVTAIGTDITERKKAEQELIIAKEKAEESEELFRKIITTVPDIIIRTNLDGIIVFSNDALIKQFPALTKDKVIGKNIFEFIVETDLPRAIENTKRMFEQSLGIQEYNLKLYDEIIYNCEVNGEVLRDSDSQPNGMVYVIRNITERKQIELELIKAKEKAEESEFKIRSMFENTQIGILYCDSLGNILEVNPILLDILGSPSAEATKKINTLTFKPLLENGFAQNMVKCIRDKKIVTDDTVYTSKWGKTVFMKYYLVPVIVNNEVIGVWANLNNLTDLYEVQEQLKTAKEKAEESDRLKSAFLANMSHEIRTPMNGILGFASLLKEPDLSGSEQKQYIGVIERSGERMLNIINDIIDISKIESGTMELNIKEQNINTQLKYILAFFKLEAQNKGLKLILKNTLPAEKAKISTDGEKVSAILINLIKNAIKYTDEGFIEFGCDFIEKQDSSFLQFSVKDTGIGISKERKNIIFERFIQEDIQDIHARQGVGLGLSISRAYIEMLGGRIWVESKKGKGSKFYFTIPIESIGSEETEEENKSKIINKFNPLNLKILLAEDDKTSSNFISIILSDYSKEIIKVKTGKETIETCRLNPDIDLILMDIQMPEINGYEATKQIRQFNKEVIIIAQTAYGLISDREKALEAGCNDYIAKPIKKEKLIELLEKYFNK